ncbi:MAG: hypothetical protein HGB12_00950 [Bacteroidetes bacterium]|nr:hypothetical protein [Bacteroidota bacterium]
MKAINQLRKSQIKYIRYTFFCLTIFITTSILNYNSFAQRQKYAYGTAAVCIYSASDTMQHKAPPVKEVKIGSTAKEVLEILNYPNDKLIIENTNKEKWMYEDRTVYFENNRVKIIQQVKSKKGKFIKIPEQTFGLVALL